jgi:hypothetical protein
MRGQSGATGCGYDGLRHYTGEDGERPYARCPRCNNYLAVAPPKPPVGADGQPIRSPWTTNYPMYGEPPLRGQSE